MTADEALERLKQGNLRFMRGRAESGLPDRDWLSAMSEQQQPFATIFGCSDSRVPPEIVFDQGLGELFIVRVAGNVVGTETLGSLGYALEHLETPLFVVLGHQGCGAVKAALVAKFHGAQEQRAVADLVAQIVPSLDGIDAALSEERQWHEAVEANVRAVVRRLTQTPAGAEALRLGRIRIVGAICELATGRVRFLDGDEARGS